MWRERKNLWNKNLFTFLSAQVFAFILLTVSSGPDKLHCMWICPALHCIAIKWVSVWLIRIHSLHLQWSALIFLLAPGIPVTPGATGQPPAGEGGSNVVRKRQKTSSDPESDASESKFYTGHIRTKCCVSWWENYISQDQCSPFQAVTSKIYRL